MSKRLLLSCSMMVELMALLLALWACQRASRGVDSSPAGPEMQSKARVFDLTERTL